MGRPTRFTEATRNAIYLNLQDCPFYTAAAEKAGISRVTLNHWLRRGEKDDESGLKTDFAEFFNRVRKLKAVAQIDLFGVIKNQAKKDWNAARYVLQCLDGKLYGAKAAVKIEDASEDASVFDTENIHAKLVDMVGKIEGDE